MRLALALGVAFTALTVAANAQPQQHHGETRVVIRHGGGHEINFDANNDGWLTRDEASAGADRMFAELDTNNDGRLNGEDRPNFGMGVDVEVEEGTPAPEAGDRHVRVIRRGHDEHSEQHEERDGDRIVERTVIIHSDGGDDETDEEGMAAPIPPEPPHPPHPPRAPMFMMMVMNSDEADLNNDGSLSRDEFRAQQLRFFDASDANRDGRVKFEPPPPPPEPPAPPAPPQPPEPPRRH